MVTETSCQTAPFALLARAKAIHRAAEPLLQNLARGERIDARCLRHAMQTAFGASDAEGSWDWKTAYEACEIAAVLFLAKYGPAIIKASNGSPSAMLPMVSKIAALLPSHTRRSMESQSFQQFSTPLPLALAAAAAAQVTSADRVLEPSAGTGSLAIFAELAGGSLVLNELAASRAALLDLVFAGLTVTRFDAAQIDDYLDRACLPSVVLMNPPFSATVNVDRPQADTTLRHVSSALARLGEGGRLVAITAAGFAPDNPTWTDAFVRLQERGRLVFSAAIDGSVYARQGTTTATRLLVIDKQAGAGSSRVSAVGGNGTGCADLARLDHGARAAAAADGGSARRAGGGARWSPCESRARPACCLRTFFGAGPRAGRLRACL
ncbi:hypothetical protein ACVILH_002165 [Bradyrhizobium sp. USDA 4353]